MRKLLTAFAVTACCATRALAQTIAFVLAFYTFIGASSSMSEEIARTTFDGVPLDEPILVNVGGVQLRVPAGYLVQWPNQKMRNRMNNYSNGIRISFWMPERRYVEVNALSYSGSSPKEPGRSLPPSSDIHTVSVTIEPRKLDESDDRSPVKQFHNLTSYPGPSSYSLKEEPFGLVRFWQHDWPYPKPEAFVNYRHVEGSDPQILFQCTPPNKFPMPQYPLCEGIGYFAADEISFRILFEPKALPRWRENVFAMRELFNAWKVPSQQQ